MKDRFTKGRTYTREDVADKINLPADKRHGNWSTGYAPWQGEFFVFCNVGVAGRTGHDYPNKWDGDELVWYGKGPSHRTQPQIQKMTSGAAIVHIFWRKTDRAPFTYAGQGKSIEVSDTTPVRVRWRFD